LTRTSGNISRAALELGVSRPTMHDLLHKHRIASKDVRFRPLRSLAGNGAIEAPAVGGYPAISNSDPQNDGV
jgi:hypothetical protein